jgi:hypothetical protein
VYNVTPGQIIELTIGAGNTVIGELATLIAGTVASSQPTTKLGYAAGYKGGEGDNSANNYGFGGAYGFGGGGGIKSGYGGGGAGIGGNGGKGTTSSQGVGGGSTGGAGGTKYISGNGARAYQVEEHFIDQGLELEYLDYKPIEYPQLWGEFLPCMSVLDYIFNCGYDWDNVIRKVAEKNGNR